MSNKTLGQVAYEGWDSDVMTHKPWSEVPAEFQGAWQAAAEAVVMQTTVDAVLLPQGRAVIEAAKAVLHSESWNQADAVHDLNGATEALEEVERG